MNLDWLHRRRVSYKCYPYSDKPTFTNDWGWYYENGTDERYWLFAYRNAKIKTLKSLYWNLSVIYWINSIAVRKYEPISNSQFKSVCDFLSRESNGFVDFFVSQQQSDKMYWGIISSKKKPFNNKVKFVFRDGSGLSFKEKMSIMSGFRDKTKCDDKTIKESINKIHLLGGKVTNKSLSLIIGCSEKTVQRNLTDELKDLKNTLNDEMVQRRKL